MQARRGARAPAARPALLATLAVAAAVLAALQPGVAAAPAPGQASLSPPPPPSQHHAHFAIEQPAPGSLPDKPTTVAAPDAAERNDRLAAALGGADAAEPNLDRQQQQQQQRQPAAAGVPAAGTQAREARRAAAAREEGDKGKTAQSAPIYDVEPKGAMKMACAECRQWFATQPDPAGWTAVLPDCPCKWKEAEEAPGWHRMQGDVEKYFPGAEKCVLSSPVHTHGQQCCYTGSGHLITSGLGAGTPHMFAHPTVLRTPAALHWLRDVVPFQQCCHECLSPGCGECHSKFYAKRPPNQGASGACPSTPSPAAMPFCEPREHVCFRHEGRLYVKASGSCVAGSGPGAAQCAAHPNTPCSHDCVAGETDEISLGCHCAREVFEGADVVCVETVPLVRALE